MQRQGQRRLEMKREEEEILLLTFGTSMPVAPLVVVAGYYCC